MADEIERWSEELARDPASGVFIPLADALRRRGQLDLAARVATRGLSRRPYDGDAHDLLARIWADRGDVQRAMDEWSMALECAPAHPGALKGMGFACYQVGRTDDAERYLVEAAAADPDDASIRAALVRLRRQRGEAAAAVDDTPPTLEPVSVEEPAEAAPSEASPHGTDPRLAFADLLGSEEQTALLVDGDGLVLAGSYVVADGRDVAQDVGAALSGVSDEARRAMRHLSLGSWTSLQFETAAATVAMAPLSAPGTDGDRAAGSAEPRGGYRDGLALVAAGRAVPLGLVRRVLTRVVERAAAWYGQRASGRPQ